jgi:hypothetical protein
LKREEDDQVKEIRVDHVENVNEAMNVEEDHQDDQNQMVLKQIRVMKMKKMMNQHLNTLFNRL